MFATKNTNSDAALLDTFDAFFEADFATDNSLLAGDNDVLMQEDSFMPSTSTNFSVQETFENMAPFSTDLSVFDGFQATHSVQHVQQHSPQTQAAAPLQPSAPVSMNTTFQQTVIQHQAVTMPVQQTSVSIQQGPYVMKKHILRPQKVERIVYANPASTSPRQHYQPQQPQPPTQQQQQQQIPVMMNPQQATTSPHQLVQQLIKNQQQTSSFFQPMTASAPASPMPQGQAMATSPVFFMHPPSPRTQQEMKPQQPNVFFNNRLLSRMEMDRPRSRSCPTYLATNPNGLPQMPPGFIMMPQKQVVKTSNGISKRRRRSNAHSPNQDAQQSQPSSSSEGNNYPKSINY
jgi:hypothetical protein